MSIFGLSFLYPWVLAGLVILPALWLLLKVLPPSPKIVKLPTIRFLMGLQSDETQTSTTPWWLLLLRFLTVMCVIIGLARPVYNAATSETKPNNSMIIIDNSWAAAQNWQSIVSQAETIIQNTRETVRIVPTIQQTHTQTLNALSPAQAMTALKTIAPYPFETNFKEIGKTLDTISRDDILDVFIVSGGINTNGYRSFIETTKPLGSITIYHHDTVDLPAVLKGKSLDTITLNTIPGAPDNTYIVSAKTANGQVIAQDTIQTSANKNSYPVQFTLQNETAARIDIAAQNHAGATLLLPETGANKTVCIVGNDGDDDTTPLITGDYYLTRALKPFATVTQNQLATCLEGNPGMIILTGTTPLPAVFVNDTAKWIENGGILLRFAGDAVIDNDSLMPVPMRLTGGRSLDGVLTWETPATLTSFTETSPLSGLRPSADVTITKQILAEPISAAQGAIWATLNDGTPFITGAARGRGLTVFVHTTASPDWSDFALSKSYIDVLKRLVDLAGTAYNADDFITLKTLHPIKAVDAYGDIIDPPPSGLPIDADAFDTMKPSADHPPGLYGEKAFARVLNLGNTITPLNKAPKINGTQTKTYTGQTRRDYGHILLGLAAFLFVLDWILLLMLYGTARRIVLVVALLCITPFAHAETYADGFYLAYVETGNPARDALTKQGLNALKDALTLRTSVETKDSVGVDIAADTLAFFPMLYWVLSDTSEPLPDAARQNLQTYMDNGGIVIIDTADGASPNVQAVLNGLTIPPLMPVPENHVLTKSFYLLQDFPGRHSGNDVWIARTDAATLDGVSPMIIGSNDWAGAWASGGRSRQSEMALRFGVNVVMYALVGNYKSDQVHVPAILKRMGRE